MKKEYQLIKNKTFDKERELYNQSFLEIINCTFKGPNDGESFLKESHHIILKKCLFDLRYPMWHSDDIFIYDSKFDTNSRASLWYNNKVHIFNCDIDAIKIFRESKNISIKDSVIKSDEALYFCNNINIDKLNFQGKYGFFYSKNIDISNMNFEGRYSFQYVKNVYIKDSKLNTKDAFWHSNHVTCVNCVLDGEYLGWYSKNLTLINCVIKSRQPLCYCHNLKLINCKMIQCDLAFENSIVHADIVGEVDSILNPKKGKIKLDGCKNIIIDNKPYKSKGKVIIKNR